MNKNNLKETVDMLQQLQPNMLNLSSEADRMMQMADGIGSNALYVLRQERELISGDDMVDFL